MIFEASQSEFFRFKFILLSSEILKIQEFNTSTSDKFEVFLHDSYSATIIFLMSPMMTHHP